MDNGHTSTQDSMLCKWGGLDRIRLCIYQVLCVHQDKSRLNSDICMYCTLVLTCSVGDHGTLRRHQTLTTTDITRCIIYKFARCVATDRHDEGTTTVNKRKNQTHSVYVMSVAAFTLQSQALGGVGAPNVFLDMVSLNHALVPVFFQVFLAFCHFMPFYEALISASSLSKCSCQHQHIVFVS